MHTHLFNHKRSLAVLVTLFTLGLSGCTSSFNFEVPNTVPSSTSNLGTVNDTTGTTSTTSNTGIDRHVISNVTIAAGAANSTGFTTNIFFDTGKSTAPISNHCNTAGGVATPKTCLCQFTWSEINPNSATTSPISRTVLTNVSNVQNQLISCSAPEVYATEIINNTQIKVTVIASPSNGDASLFSVNTFTFKKTAASTLGSFQDAQGRIFDNIVHYACYQSNKKALEITNKHQSETNPNGGQATVVIGSQFCILENGAASSEDCPGSPADFSAQSYYFNLYIRNSEKGDINTFNSGGFTCPKVKESLGSDGSLASQGHPWPMDSSFALSLAPTAEFGVAVEANSKLSGLNDPTSAGSQKCFPSANSSGTTQQTNTGVTSSCLGFAAKVNSDGTCPNIKDSSGTIRSTYRLRRYISVMPRAFSASGKPIFIPQPVDTIYVLDRPVKGPSNADPLKPYTMLGPKPCPFAFFDKKNVTRGGSGYYGSNDSRWRGKNYDGTEFPNEDRPPTDSRGGSCSASFPILNDEKSTFSIVTVNINNTNPTGAPFKHVYIRPVEPFVPHFEEDTDFQACAPQASPMKDPPLHFALDPDSNQVAWCAENYPTQNSNLPALDPAPLPNPSPTGNIVPYTSHVVKNSASQKCSAVPNVPASTSTYKYQASTGQRPACHKSTNCNGVNTSSTTPPDADPDTASLPTPAKDAERSSASTCDRTVIASEAGWPRFPLLAPPKAVEDAIVSDKSYQCTITYDNNGGKTGKLTPSDGCCDRSTVFVQTGTFVNGGAKNKAHLEPDAPCRAPAY